METRTLRSVGGRWKSGMNYHMQLVGVRPYQYPRCKSAQGDKMVMAPLSQDNRESSWPLEKSSGSLSDSGQGKDTNGAPK